MEQLNPFWMIGLMLLVGFLPLLASLATAYVKVNIVLGMLRSALGAQQVPSALVVMALSLAITLHIMAPVFEKSAKMATELDLNFLFKQPTLEGVAKLKPALSPWRDFLEKHAGDRELKTLTSGLEVDEDVGEEASEASSTAYGTLLLAFIISELKEAFAMGFVLLLPFLAVDLIVANILVGLGMFMVSPMMISLPLKIVLFVVADGWILLTKALIDSYNII